MQLDRRLLVGAGLGLGAAVTAGSAGAQVRQAKAAPTPAEVATGLEPDSGRDETERLQAALDRAAERRQPLVLPAGRFVVRTLTLRSGAHLIGTGGGTVLAHAGGGPAIAATNVANVTLEGLAVRGGPALAAPAKALIQLSGVEGLRLRGLKVERSPANGIALERCAGEVSHCRIGHATLAGLLSIDASGLEISHNTVTDCANNGILVWRSTKGEDGTIVAMNRLERIGAQAGGSGQNGNGINVFRAGDVLVSANRIADCAFSAVRANSASNVQIIANNAVRMGEVAIYAEFAFEGAVIAGNIIDGATTGISVTNFNEGGRLATVQGNVVRNIGQRKGEPTTSGFGIAVEADTAVSGNTIERAGTAGVMIGWGRFARQVAATGNVIRQAPVGIGITSDPGAGAVLVASNMIAGASAGAIRAMDHGRPVGSELSGTTAGGRITATGNVVA